MGGGGGGLSGVCACVYVGVWVGGGCARVGVCVCV